MGPGSFTGGASDACGRCIHPNFGIYGDLEVQGQWVEWKKELMCIGYCLYRCGQQRWWQTSVLPVVLLVWWTLVNHWHQSEWQRFILEHIVPLPKPLSIKMAAYGPVTSKAQRLLSALMSGDSDMTSLSMAERESVSPWSFKKCPLLLECLYLE